AGGGEGRGGQQAQLSSRGGVESGKRVGKAERFDAIGRLPVDIEGDLTAHRESAERERLNAEMIQESEVVRCERFQRCVAGRVRQGAVSVTAKVGHDHAMRAPEECRLRIPHREVEWMPVNEQYRSGSGAVMDIQTGHAVD